MEWGKLERGMPFSLKLKNGQERDGIITRKSGWEIYVEYSINNKTIIKKISRKEFNKCFKEKNYKKEIEKLKKSYFRRLARKQHNLFYG